MVARAEGRVVIAIVVGVLAFVAGCVVGYFVAVAQVIANLP